MQIRNASTQLALRGRPVCASDGHFACVRAIPCYIHVYHELRLVGRISTPADPVYVSVRELSAFKIQLLLVGRDGQALS